MLVSGSIGITDKKTRGYTAVIATQNPLRQDTGVRGTSAGVTAEFHVRGLRLEKVMAGFVGCVASVLWQECYTPWNIGLVLGFF